MMDLHCFAPAFGSLIAGDPVVAPTIACWAMVHGLVALVIDGAFFARDAEVPNALDALLDATLQHLDLG